MTQAPEKHYAAFMRSLGIDLQSPHAKDTPRRVARMFEELTIGLRKCPFDFTAFPKDPRHTYDQLVICKDIPFYSLCAHHHVPFVGKAHVGYLPDKLIVGLSKIVRLVQWVGRKPSIQEDLTEEIARRFADALSPKCVMVMLEAEHFCISMRGVQQPGTKTITHCILGSMSLKEEFLKLVKP